MEIIGGIAIPGTIAYFTYKTLHKEEDVEIQKMNRLIEGFKTSNTWIVTVFPQSEEKYPFIDRAQAIECFSESIKMDNREVLYTLVVMGPRECGKSTLIFEKQKGGTVFFVRLNENDDSIDKVVTQIFDAVGIVTIPATLLSKQQIMEKAFRELRRIGYPRPKLVVEVNERITSVKIGRPVSDAQILGGR